MELFKNKKITVSTFCHTHWDYEWYFTENESIIQLIYHMDEVIEFLKSNKERIYILDGQMAILEDFLQYVPEKKDEIKQFVQNGQLIIGPWYSQTDELIISGESMVRNLFYGIELAQQYGSYMNVGYLPDSFGQAQNMPKILSGFNIPYAIFWRGVDRTQVNQREFIWKSGKDEVLCYNIKNGYFFGGESWIGMSNPKEIENIFLSQCKTNKVLLPIGSDQRKVDFNYSEIMEEYNKLNSDCNYIEQSPEDFMNILNTIKDSLPIVKGEFISSQDSKIHHSIYSIRYDHKYLQDKIERRLIYQIEPLSVMLGIDGIPIKCNAIREIWKILMRSQAHDSACGCNSDNTNEIILSRLKKADQLSYSLLDYILRKYTESINTITESSVVLINTLFLKRKKTIKIMINTKKQRFEISLKDKIINFEVLSQEIVYGGIFGNDISKYDDNLYYYQTYILLTLNFNPYEKIVLNISEKNCPARLLTIENNTIVENEFYCLEVVNGKINLCERKNGRIINDLISIMNDADDGDSYDFSPINNLEPIQCDFSNTNISTCSRLNQLIIKGNWNIPKNIENREKGIFSAKIPFELKITLNEKQIDCHLKIVNSADSHRFRVYFKTPLKCNYSFADTAFGLVERECCPIAMDNWRDNGYKEEPTPIYPMINLCGLRNEKTIVTVFSKGIKEYEIIDNSSIALTLFRAVGKLGKADLIRRPGNPSGNQFKIIETPDAQINKSLTFKFSYSIKDIVSDAKIVKECQDYMVTIPYYQKQNLNDFTNTIQYFKINPLLHVQMNVLCLNFKNDDIVITALIPINNKEFAMRLANFSNRSTEINFEIPKYISKCKITNMKYDLIDKVNIKESKLLQFNSKEIKTIVFSINKEECLL